MANQRLQYTIAFTADTEQAKRQLKSLQNDLTNLVNGSSQFRDGGLGITREIAEATNQAALLKAQLQLATNQDTGKLNLTKFSQSLRNSGNDLTQIRNNLYTLGRDGQQSFVNLAAAITNAETPLISLNS